MTIPRCNSCGGFCEGPCNKYDESRYELALSILSWHEAELEAQYNKLKDAHDKEIDQLSNTYKQKLIDLTHESDMFTRLMKQDLLKIINKVFSDE